MRKIYFLLLFLILLPYGMKAQDNDDLTNKEDNFAFDLTMKKDGEETTTFTYGNTITIEGSVKVAESTVNTLALEQDVVQLYCGETPLDQAVNVEDGFFTLTYDTGEKGIPIGYQTLTVKYGGSDAFNEASETVEITLNKKPVTAQVTSERITKQYNGDLNVQVDLNFAEGALIGDDVVTVLAPDAKFSDPNVGNDKEITLGNLVVGGDDAGWYEVFAPENVTGTIIMASTRLNVSVNQNGKFVYGDKVIVTFTPEAEYVPLPSNRSLSVNADNAVLYFEDEDDNEVVLARTTGGEDDVFTLTYDTKEKKLPCDDEPFMLYIKYGGSSNLQGTEGYAQITLERAPLRNTPTVTGDFMFGKTLTANYTKQDDEEVSYQWYRSSEKIPGATGTSYKLTTEDIGKSIYVEITATDDWHVGVLKSIQQVAKAPLDEDAIEITTSESTIELGSEGTILTATIINIDDDMNAGTWDWKSGNEKIVEVKKLSPKATTRSADNPIESTAQVTPKGVGQAIITVIYDSPTYHGEKTYEITVKEKEEEEPEEPVTPDYPDYYNIYVDECEGVTVETSTNVVREGNSMSFTVEVAEGYTAEDMVVKVKRSLFGYTDIIEPNEEGKYEIRNIWTEIYITVEGVEKETPTGIEEITGVKVYTKEGSLYVQTPKQEEVRIISISGAVIKNETQIGLQRYDLPRGIYIICIGEERVKVRN